MSHHKAILSIQDSYPCNLNIQKIYIRLEGEQNNPLSNGCTVKPNIKLKLNIISMKPKDEFNIVSRRENMDRKFGVDGKCYVFHDN